MCPAEQEPARWLLTGLLDHSEGGPVSQPHPIRERHLGVCLRRSEDSRCHSRTVAAAQKLGEVMLSLSLRYKYFILSIAMYLWLMNYSRSGFLSCEGF